MNVLDSCAWIEFLKDGPHAGTYAAMIEDAEDLVTPALVVFEVFTWVSRNHSEDLAFDITALMARGSVVDLDTELAIEAARLSAAEGLAMADAIILATARHAGATLWTQDAHFAGHEGVELLG